MHSLAKSRWSLRHNTNQPTEDTNDVQPPLYVAEPISCSQFILQHAENGRPALFGSWLTAGWPANRQWVHQEISCSSIDNLQERRAQKIINFEAIAGLLPHERNVGVVNLGPGVILDHHAAKPFDCRPECFDMTFGAFVDNWRRLSSNRRGNIMKDGEVEHTVDDLVDLHTGLASLGDNYPIIASPSFHKLTCGRYFLNAGNYNGSPNGSAPEKMDSKDDDSRRFIYLKDLHLRLLRPDLPFYTRPPLFCGDYLNYRHAHSDHRSERNGNGDNDDDDDDDGLVFWLSGKKASATDDYCFVYLGMPGTWTPFHFDVMRSYSWSSNICGIKLWLLVPPGEEKKMDAPSRSSTRTHALDEVQISDIRWLRDVPPETCAYRVVQMPGETVFVPSSWHHQVINIGNTVSINHNWITAQSIEHVTAYILHVTETARKMVAHLRNSMDLFEFDEAVDRMTLGSAGINTCQLADLIARFAVDLETMPAADISEPASDRSRSRNDNGSNDVHACYPEEERMQDCQRSQEERALGLTHLWNAATKVWKDERMQRLLSGMNVNQVTKKYPLRASHRQLVARHQSAMKRIEAWLYAFFEESDISDEWTQLHSS